MINKFYDLKMEILSSDLDRLQFYLSITFSRTNKAKIDYSRENALSEELR